MTAPSPSVLRDLRETQTWPRDPLLYHLDFPFRASFSPLGFPMCVSSNSPALVAAAEQTWGRFPALFAAEPIHLRVGVSEICSELPQPPVLRAHRGIITVISNALNFAVCDVTAGFSFGWFTPAVVADADFFRYHFLDLMVGLLLAPVHFAIVHAACVAYRGSGFLLCGHSGAGKSTLAYACAQRGWTFISDDAGHIPLRSPSRAVVGNPLFLRLRENSADLFPQLEDRPVILRQNGEFGFELSTDTLPGLTRAFQADIEHIVFLDRQPAGPARLLPTPSKTPGFASKTFSITPSPAKLQAKLAPTRTERLPAGKYASARRPPCANCFPQPSTSSPIRRLIRRSIASRGSRTGQKSPTRKLLIDVVFGFQALQQRFEEWFVHLGSSAYGLGHLFRRAGEVAFVGVDSRQRQMADPVVWIFA